MEKIIVTLWMLFGFYTLVLLAMMADLWAGVRKAKKLGIAASSYGFKRTVDKAARYYNFMIALTVIDAMQMAAIWYLEQFYGYRFPFFPFITLLGAIGIGLIEIKSIYEKAEDKIKIDNVAELAKQVARNKEDIGAVADAVVDYLKKKDEEKGGEQ
jgi:hypothetical protein